MNHTINYKVTKPPVKSITLELTVEEFYIIGRALYDAKEDETIEPHSRFIAIRTEAGLKDRWK